MKTLMFLGLCLLLVSSQTPPGATAPAVLEGTPGPGIRSCGISAESVLSATGLPAGQAARYVFYDQNGQWLAEQWTFPGLLRVPDHLLASQDSINRADIRAMHCALLPLDELSLCGPKLVVDEGPSIAFVSLLITQNAVLSQFEATYENFFSQRAYQLQDQAYFVQLDGREVIELIVTGTRTQLFTMRFANVKPGQHRLLYGMIDADRSKSPPGTQRFEEAACFTVPATEK